MCYDITIWFRVEVVSSEVLTDEREMPNNVNLNGHRIENNCSRREKRNSKMGSQGSDGRYTNHERIKTSLKSNSYKEKCSSKTEDRVESQVKIKDQIMIKACLKFRYF